MSTLTYSQQKARAMAQIQGISLIRSAILLMLLLAFWVRIYHLDGQALRGDEAATVHYSAMPVGELWELSRVTDPHPPLYYLLLHPWQWLLGDGVWIMRFAGVLAGVLAVTVLYRLARLTLRSPTLAVLAAALLAVNPLQIWQAQDIRAYVAFTLFGLLSSWALWHALHRRQQTNDHLSPVSYSLFPIPYSLSPWLLYALLTIACLYIHYYTIFLILFQGLFVLINARRFWSYRWPWLIAQTIIALAILPGLLLAYNFIGPAAGGIETIPTLEILRRAGATLLTGFTLETGLSTWLSLLLAPVWLIGLITLLRRDFTAGTFWGLFFAIPVLGVIALSIDRPFFKERFLIQAQPAFELLLATGFLAIGRIATNDQRRTTNDERRTIDDPDFRRTGQRPAGRSTHSSLLTPHSSLLTLHSSPTPHHVSRITFYVLRFTFYALLTLLLYANLHTLANYFTDPAYAKAPPWQLYHDYVREHAQPGDVMLTNFPEASVSYYSPDELPFYVVPAERDLPAADRIQATEQIATAYERIWFLPLLRQGFDEQGDVLNWLDRHADRVHQVFFPAYNLNLYLSPPTIEQRMIRYPAAFAHGIELRGYQIFDRQGRSRLSTAKAETTGPWLLSLKPNEAFTLSLYWRAGGPTAEPYTVFTHLIAADGFNRTGQDNQPVWGSYPTTAWPSGELITDKYTLTIPAGAPAGDHYLAIGWYPSATGARVAVLDSRGQSGADHLILNTIIRVE